MAKESAGYSETPLLKKLGVKEEMRLGLSLPTRAHCERIAQAGRVDGVDWTEAVNALRACFFDLPLGATVEETTSRFANCECVLLAVLTREMLEDQFAPLTKDLAPDAAMWIAWPKKSSGLFVNLTEDGIREVVLPTGYVDIKVCAIDAVWSGLKVVLRKELRPASPRKSKK